jgi:mono/diheme cytochrome c family protein
MRSRCIVLALALCVGGASARADEMVMIDQGWSVKQKVEWYTLTQGSRLLPLSWFRALEQPGSTKLFLERDYIEGFRYLPHASAGAGRLPVGFTIDTQDDSDLGITQLRWKEGQSSREAWMGLNCSACHTSEITYKGKRMRLEGGATLADAQRFIDELNRALVETRDNAEKQDRFAKVVLKGAYTRTNRRMLKQELERYVAWQQQLEKANATPLRYGFARLDAFGFIFNKILALTEATDQHVNPSDAPVSYPFLWNIHQFDKVQWNGIADSKLIGPTYDIGALGRNVGEVIGVFADVKLRRAALDGFTSSANIHNLDRLEQLLAQLKPPAWPQAVLGKIDPARQAAGQALFATRCAKCHAPLARDDLKSRITVTMTPLKGTDPAGTDAWMACNAYTYQGKTGLLRLAPQKFFPVPPVKLFGETAPVAQLLGATAAGVIWNNRDDVIRDALGTVRTDIARTKGGPLAKAKGVVQFIKGKVAGKRQKDIAEKIQDISYFEIEPSPQALGEPPANLQLAPTLQPPRSDDKAARLRRCLTDDNPLLAYKGRPLTGIWASPPYLHNGSVPTLYDLLLPPDQRPQAFYLGSREFDPDKVGYVTAQSAENSFEFRTRDEAGRVIDGNSNAGHDYGNASLSEADRRALVEYMKSL